MRYAACPRPRVDLSNKNNIQLKGNNNFALIFIVTILYLEPFWQFSVRKFLSYSFYIKARLYCKESECVRTFSSQDFVAAAAADAAASLPQLVPNIASFMSYSLCDSELVYCLLHHTALYIMTKSQYYCLQIIQFVYL